MNCLHKTVYTAFTIHTVFINFTDNTVQRTALALLRVVLGIMDCAGPYWVVLGSERLYWVVLGPT